MFILFYCRGCKVFLCEYCRFIVGKGGHTPFSKISIFLEVQDVPTFHRFIGKTKVLNNSCNRFVYNFYPQSILVLEQCFKKWWKTWYNAFMKRDTQSEKGIWNSYLKLSPTRKEKLIKEKKHKRKHKRT